MNIVERTSAQNLWTRVSLGEVLTLVNGRAYRQEELLERGTPVIRIQNLNGGDKWYYSDLKLRDDKYCDDGDLLFAWSATFGPYFWNGSRAIYHYHIWKVIPSPRIEKRFAFYLLQSITDRVRASGRGISMIHMTKAAMDAWPVDLPPLHEQHRIAAILDRVNAIRRKRNRALDLITNLTHSIFLEMFGDPVTNPKKWPCDLLGNVCDVRDGTHASPKYVEKGFPLLTSKNFSGGEIDYTGARLISVEDYSEINRRSKVEIGDIVMPMIGTIGSPVLIETCPDFAIKNVALFKFRIDSPLPEFIVRLLDGPLLQAKITSAARGGTQKFLSLADLRSLKIPLPPRNTQSTFKQIAIAHSKVRIQYRAAVSLIDCLFSSLQNRAFSGQL